MSPPEFELDSKKTGKSRLSNSLDRSKPHVFWKFQQQSRSRTSPRNFFIVGLHNHTTQCEIKTILSLLSRSCVSVPSERLSVPGSLCWDAQKRGASLFPRLRKKKKIKNCNSGENWQLSLGGDHNASVWQWHHPPLTLTQQARPRSEGTARVPVSRPEKSAFFVNPLFLPQTS